MVDLLGIATLMALQCFLSLFLSILEEVYIMVHTPSLEVLFEHLVLSS